MVNFVDLQVLIRADGAVSQIMGIQIPGRLARLAEDKDYAYLIDVEDTFSAWARRRAEAREKLYQEQKWQKATREEVLDDLGKKRDSDSDVVAGEDKQKVCGPEEDS